MFVTRGEAVEIYHWS